VWQGRVGDHSPYADCVPWLKSKPGHSEEDRWAKPSRLTGWSGVIKGRPNVGVSAELAKAVGVDEEIIGRVEIKEVRPDKPMCKIETTVRNQAGGACFAGRATAYTVPLRKY
jgi:hypothetical protein